jgi:hypothetical protein
MFGKLWRAFAAQVNKLANFFWQADPIAQMQLEYDNAVEQLKEGRQGLEQYRALVERVNRQVRLDEKRVQDLTAKVKSYLAAAARGPAGKFAIELPRAKDDLKENQAQLEIHEKSYRNNLTKINMLREAGGRPDENPEIRRGTEDEFRRSGDEPAGKEFDFDVTTDFGQLETLIQEKIDLNAPRCASPATSRAKALRKSKPKRKWKRQGGNAASGI